MRHWLVTDENHSHYLILAEDETEALVRLKQHTKFDDPTDYEFFVVLSVPDVARIDDDSGWEQFYPDE